MGRPVTVARSAAWIAIAAAVPLIAIAAFLGDFLPLEWEDWAIAGAIVASVAGAIVTFRRDSFGRALTWFASLTVVALLIIYDVLDAIIDPFVKADWPVAVVAILLVAGLGGFLTILIADDE